ncbi:MAG: hypothetical protein Q9170_003384 [Blastenia crenularia]
MTPYFDVQSQSLPGQHIREYPAATANCQEETLNIHIKQYTPAHRKSCPDGAVTIIAAHANGFPKELYEPLWEDLCQNLEREGLNVRSVWMADVANQGMSSVLNEDKLGNDRECIKRLVKSSAFQPLTAFASELDGSCPGFVVYHQHAARQDAKAVGRHRPQHGRQYTVTGPKKNVMTNLALMHPRLLSSLVLIDPVIEIPSARPRNTASALLTQLSTFRRDLWPSRDEAAASFRSSKFYQTWDERVLNRWLDVGLRDTPTALYPRTDRGPKGTPVTLLTSKHQEVFTFLRPNFDGMDRNGRSILDRSINPDLDLESGETYPFYRPEPPSTFKRLPYLRPSVLYVHGGKSDLSAPKLREQRMRNTGIGVGGSGGAPEGRVKQILFKDAGHLMPMEIVGELADAAAEWLVQEMGRWKQQEKEFKLRWSSKSSLEKQTVSDEWRGRIGGDPRVASNKSQL